MWTTYSAQATPRLADGRDEDNRLRVQLRRSQVHGQVVVDSEHAPWHVAADVKALHVAVQVREGDSDKVEDRLSQKNRHKRMGTIEAQSLGAA